MSGFPTMRGARDLCCRFQGEVRVLVNHECTTIRLYESAVEFAVAGRLRWPVH